MSATTQIRDVKGFERSAEAASKLLLSSRSVLVIGHIDADGITAASIASMALDRAGKDYSVRFIKKLDDAELEKVRDHGAERLWFVDLGSGAYSKLPKGRCVVTDHHRLDPAADQAGAEGHVNPHIHGLDGSSEISGAGVTYLVAKMMDLRNRDLSALAVVGAVGDFQDAAEGALVGYNRTILDDAVSTGLVKAERDIRLFGRQTRPLHAFILYSSEPPLLPFLTGRRGRQNDLDQDVTEQDEDKMACIDFLTGLGIPLRSEERYRTWADLTREEKMRVVSALVNRMVDAGKGEAFVRRLIGEAYTLSPNLPGTPPEWYRDNGAMKGAELSDSPTWRPTVRALFDAKEFATLLNACGRHDQAPLGKRVCLGDRKSSLDDALLQQDNHREQLRKAIDLVKRGGHFRPTTVSPNGTPLRSIRYFHGRDSIEDTIVGIVAGMLLGSAELPADRPVIAFAEALDGTDTVKVSGRGTRDMTKVGLDLSVAMREASESVGGSGGGHNIAAGASVPSGKEDEFLLTIDAIIFRQLNPSA